MPPARRASASRLAAGLTAIACGLFALSAAAQTSTGLPDSTSARFCVALQHMLASTTREADNTLFDNMAEYRHSKPGIEPLRIYQVVTYAGRMPVVVSCKMKTAAHIRAAYGAAAAGEQKYCDAAARELQRQAVADLRRDGRPAAAEAAAVFVVDRTEPYITGQAYLKDFVPIYRAPDGAIHVNSPGLYQDYDAWYTALLPEFVKGQSYCHLASVELIKAVASGDIAPGLTVTTADEASTQPR